MGGNRQSRIPPCTPVSSQPSPAKSPAMVWERPPATGMTVAADGEPRIMISLATIYYGLRSWCSNDTVAFDRLRACLSTARHADARRYDRLPLARRQVEAARSGLAANAAAYGAGLDPVRQGRPSRDGGNALRRGDPRQSAGLARHRLQHAAPVHRSRPAAPGRG